jgi:ubiquitin-protein ligase E3 C
MEAHHALLLLPPISLFLPPVTPLLSPSLLSISSSQVLSPLSFPLLPGLMVGKALYEGILVNVSFAPFFVARLQGRTPLFDDLATLDPELHKSLLLVCVRGRRGGLRGAR